MKHTRIIFLFIITIFRSKCEKKFLKIENCTTNEKVAVVKLCELHDGKFSATITVTKPLNEFLVRIRITFDQNLILNKFLD